MKLHLIHTICLQQKKRTTKNKDKVDENESPRGY